MNPQRIEVNVTTDENGDAEVYSEVVSGPIHRVHYVKDDFAAGVDFDVTLEASGEVVWDEDNVDASKTIAPRRALHSTAGAAALYAAGGEAVLGPVIAASERIKVVVANGGNAKKGKFIFVVG